MKSHWYHILLALADGPLHGAEVRRRVDAQSRGAVTLYPAMLYGSFDELTEHGWTREVDPPRGSEHGRRRFYALTPGGRLALAEETARLESVVRTARAALGRP